jgi:hypothetical protein
MAWKCPDCGGASNFGTLASHNCNAEKYAAYQAERFEPDFKIFLSTNTGLWMTFYAQWLITGQGQYRAEDSPQG